MKEVTLYGGTIDSCLKGLREMAAADESGDVLKAAFNDKYLLSTDTDDDAYLRITGMTKADHKTKLYVSRDGDGKLLQHFAYPHWGDNHDFRSPNQVELNPLLFPEVKPGSGVEYIAGEVFDTIR